MPGGEMGGCLFLGSENAGAFQGDVHVQFLVGKLGGILDGGDFDLVAGGDHIIAVHADLGRETAMHAVIAQQMGIGFHRPQIVDGHDFDVAAARLHDRPQHQPADAAEAVDCNTQCHGSLPNYLSSFLAAATAASAEIPNLA